MVALTLTDLYDPEYRYSSVATSALTQWFWVGNVFTSSRSDSVHTYRHRLLY